MSLRGVRGATTVDVDEPDEIRAATGELIRALQAANPGMLPEDIASAIFTVTADLVSTYPAQAARELGWERVPLICAQEIPVPGGLPRCIRLLIHWNTENPASAVRHVYLRQAAILRPDLAANSQEVLS
jgi:chorismate mutase